jgi:hypothetical protein
MFAVGPTGTDYSIDRGKNWEQMNEEHTKFEGTVPGGVAPSLKK